MLVARLFSPALTGLFCYLGTFLFQRYFTTQYRYDHKAAMNMLRNPRAGREIHYDRQQVIFSALYREGVLGLIGHSRTRWCGLACPFISRCDRYPKSCREDYKQE